MSQDLTLLVGSAASLAFLHTILGPDHYLPFAAMARARDWSMRRTLWITVLCGLGHVLGSVVLGALGIAAGIGLRSLEMFESNRGEIAGWLLLAFGLAYFAWGMVRALRNRPHAHHHVHPDGTRHEHVHTHQDEHLHPHAEEGKRLVPWALFVVFLLGPCEPLIPLLMFPAVTHGPGAVVLVATVFSVVTIVTMTSLALFAVWGLRFAWTRRVERFGHPVAGALVFMCGAAIKLGL